MTPGKDTTSQTLGMHIHGVNRGKSIPMAGDRKCVMECLHLVIQEIDPWSTDVIPSLKPHRWTCTLRGTFGMDYSPAYFSQGLSTLPCLPRFFLSHYFCHLFSSPQSSNRSPNPSLRPSFCLLLHCVFPASIPLRLPPSKASEFQDDSSSSNIDQ